METVNTTKIAIIGGGKGGTALLDLLSQVPGVEISGLMDRDPHAPAMARARSLNVPITQDAQELIGDHKVNLVIDVTGDPAMMDFITANKGPEVEVLGGAGARLLWYLVQQQTQLQAQLFQTERLAGIGSFAAGIAHDINNPLHLILGFAEMILEDPSGKDTKEYAQEIIDAVNRISPICKDLTQYARRISSDDFLEVDLNAKLDEALKVARYATGHHDLIVTKRYAPQVLVNARPEEMLHACVNLIGNAIQAMDRGGTLTLETHSDTRTVTVIVSDTGCGIPRDQLDLIFQPFFTTKVPGKGTGLGLYNVMCIVKKHRGTIAVTSEVGKGTTFTLTFPSIHSESSESEP